MKDNDLAVVAKMTNLVRLQLNRTMISDAGLAHLSKLPNLETLNLYGTRVTNAGPAKHIKGLKKLKKLYLWDSQVTVEGVEQLRQQMPDVEIVY